MSHYKVFLNDKVIYDGGTHRDCWKWVRYTYPPGMTVKELLDDGIRVKP